MLYLFLYYVMMYNLKKTCLIRKVTIEEFEDFILKNRYRKIEFPEENSYHSMKHQKKKDFLLLATKLIEKISDATNAKQYYQTFLKY